METGLPERSFDVVHAHQVLQHVPDPVSTLRVMASLCRPGGALVVVVSIAAARSGAVWAQEAEATSAPESAQAAALVGGPRISNLTVGFRAEADSDCHDVRPVASRRMASSGTPLVWR